MAILSKVTVVVWLGLNQRNLDHSHYNSQPHPPQKLRLLQLTQLHRPKIQLVVEEEQLMKIPMKKGGSFWKEIEQQLQDAGKKRKVWVQSLEKKAEDLSSLNGQLQSEVTLLRNEVAQLKQLLLAHKDCPVTAMQKKSGYHAADKDDSSEDLSVPSSPHTEAIQHSSVSTSNGVSSTSKAEAVATSVLTQMADQSTEPMLSQVAMAPSSQSQPSGS